MSARTSSQGWFVLEWYRPAVGSKVARMWFIAAGALVLGCLCVGLVRTRMFALSEDASLFITIIGVLGCAFGPLTGAIFFTRLLSETRELILRSDGILFMDPPRDPVFISWSALEHARYEDSTLHLTTDAGDTLSLHQRFLGIRGTDLAARILETQKHALMGTLRRPR